MLASFRSGRGPWLALGLVVLAWTDDARAFCRTSSCPGVGTSQVCTPAAADDCGVPLFWPSMCVGFSVQKDASKYVTFDETAKTLNTAFATWMAASCSGGGKPQITVTEAEPAECNKHEYNKTAGNANIVLYHDDAWPYEGSPNTIALTTVTYNVDTGEIYDADMELNSADRHFTVGNVGIDYDLLSVVTHETGHFLGLAHSHDSSATMWFEYDPGSTSPRDLAPDDVSAICAVYPPDSSNTCCDPTPRHGFSPLCAADQTTPPSADMGTTCSDMATSGCCSVAPASTTGGGACACFAAAAGAIALAMRGARVRKMGASRTKRGLRAP